MSFRDLIISVFEKSPRGRIPWMPRLEYWYLVNKSLGRLPPEYRGLNLTEFYRKLDAYRRCYMGYFTDTAVRISYGGDVEFSSVERDGLTVAFWKTPVGVLRRIVKKAEGGFSSRIVEYPVKSVEDFKIMEYILENIEVRFDYEAYRKLEEELNGQGMVWYFFPRTPFQRLLLDYIGVERTFRLLFRERAKIEGFMEAIAKADDEIYKLIGVSPVEIVNFGDNIDARITSPKLFEKYCLPYYQERTDQLHRKGKYVHCHVDGYAKPLLPLFKETGWDGVEALTPKPVGDVSLEDIRDNLGDELILIDGIPYLYFLPEVDRAKLRDFVWKLLEIFQGRLILGISDEMPPRGDIERVRLIPEIIRGFSNASK